ncbi:excalibur calcium-binding domain-containing protein [Sphingobium sp. 3R8]|nr:MULTISPECIES: excalibur calcium-binding domain-containing protein [Sphingomonadaceae]MBZ9647120.1 excalibur calcium-binding domain-containing protein [Sphingobium sp. 3R8]
MVQYAGGVMALCLAGGTIGYLTRPADAPRAEQSEATATMVTTTVPVQREQPMSAAELDAQQPSGGAVAKPAPTVQRFEGRKVASSAPTWSYRGCNEARAAGAAPLYRGQPGYGAHMDGDNDGIACEPIRH